MLFHVTQQRFKDADKLRYAVKAASEPSEELGIISANGGNITTTLRTPRKRPKDWQFTCFEQQRLLGFLNHSNTLKNNQT